MPQRILHLPTPVGGQAWGLAQAEKALGLDSQVLISGPNILQYPADIKLGKLSGMTKLAKLCATFIKIRGKYDIFHFNYGSSLFHSYHHWWLCQPDLPYYPKSAKLFVTYNGCDARQKYPTMRRTCTAACHMRDCYQRWCNSGEVDLRRQKAIKKMAHYVQHMWAVNPDLLYFLPKEKSSFLPYSVCHQQDASSPSIPASKLKIVHAPTQRSTKGTDFILQATDRLNQKYPNSFELILVEGKPHAEALQLYRQADLVIDQILIGWYGAFAVEVMLMGKPVIARIAQEDLHFIPPQMATDLQEAIIHADPATIYHVLERSIQDHDWLKQRAEACLDYANRWHRPSYVAGITKAKYAELIG